VGVRGANFDGSRSTGPFSSRPRHKGSSASRGMRNNKILPTGYRDRKFRGLKFKVDFLKIWKCDFVQILAKSARDPYVPNGISLFPEQCLWNVQGGPAPQNSNPHNSGPEVDIDFVPTAFFIIRLGLKVDVLKVRQVAPLVCHATPPKGLNPRFSNYKHTIFFKIHRSIVPKGTIDWPSHYAQRNFLTWWGPCKVYGVCPLNFKPEDPHYRGAS